MPARLNAVRTGIVIRVKFAELRPRSTMDSIRVSEAPDPGSIPGEATLIIFKKLVNRFLLLFYLPTLVH
jgi:hypothetical protein